MAKLANKNVSHLGNTSIASKLDLGLDGKVCWADLVDDQTTDPGDSPRSIASSQDACENEIPLERTLWADMQDSESSDATPTVASTSCTPFQVSHSAPNVLKARGAVQDELDASDERGCEPENVGRIAVLAHANIDKYHMPVKGSSMRRGKGRANSIGKGVGKVGGEGRALKKGTSKGGKKGTGKGAPIEKYQCQFIIGVEEDSNFRVVRRVLGTGGENMKRIAEESGAKLRLRGRGSKFLEGPQRKESDDDLMLCVSSLDVTGFETAKRAVSELINGIHQHYRAFCRKSGHECPELVLKIHEGYRAGSR